MCFGQAQSGRNEEISIFLTLIDDVASLREIFPIKSELSPRDGPTHVYTYVYTCTQTGNGAHFQNCLNARVIESGWPRLDLPHEFATGARQHFPLINNRADEKASKLCEVLSYHRQREARPPLLDKSFVQVFSRPPKSAVMTHVITHCRTLCVALLCR